MHMLIEIRIGLGKAKLKHLLQEVRNKTGYRNKVPKVPHISLYGTFETQDERRLRQTIERVCRPYGALDFWVEGFSKMKSDKGWVIYFKIRPSDELVKLRAELCRSLRPFAHSSKRWDTTDKDYLFHSTIGLRLSNRECERVWNIISGGTPTLLSKILQIIMGQQPKPNSLKNLYEYLPMSGFRITVIGNKRIRFEYDLLQKRLLNRNQALDRDEWSRTLSCYRNQVKQTNKLSGTPTEDEKYFISDLHLDHKNIIKYCMRPFGSVHEMNRVIMDNWNTTIGDKDEIYFLGDLKFGRESRPSEYFLNQLKGKLHFIRGNHEETIAGSKEFDIIEMKGKKFYLVHDPKKVPAGWDGWVIHGHTHNSHLLTYPFINGEKKTINVSAELINFTPISMSTIFAFDLDRIKRMETLNSKPEYRIY